MTADTQQNLHPLVQLLSDVAQRGGWGPEMVQRLAADGRWRGRPERAVISSRNSLPQALPVATVREAEACLARGDLCKTIAGELRISKSVLTLIRQGRHIHQRPAVRGASVFSLCGGHAS